MQCARDTGSVQAEESLSSCWSSRRLLLSVCSPCCTSKTSSSCCCKHLEDAPDSLDVLRGILHLPQHHAARKQQAQQNGGLHFFLAALRLCLLCVCRFVDKRFTRNVSWRETSLPPSRKPQDRLEPQRQSNFPTAVCSKQDARMWVRQQHYSEVPLHVEGLRFLPCCAGSH